LDCLTRNLGACWVDERMTLETVKILVEINTDHVIVAVPQPERQDRDHMRCTPAPSVEVTWVELMWVAFIGQRNDESTVSGRPSSLQIACLRSCYTYTHSSHARILTRIRQLLLDSSILLCK